MVEFVYETLHRLHVLSINELKLVCEVVKVLNESKREKFREDIVTTMFL